MSRIILDCSHCDTCLPDYWSGHHLPHVQIPVYRGMKLSDIKRELRNELNQGAIGGNDPRTSDDSGKDGERWYNAALAAVNKIKPNVKNQRRFFMELEKQTYDDDGDSVYAFFVFVEL